jgi:hypothetical protein
VHLVVMIKYLALKINPIIIIGFILSSLTGCQSEKTPLETTKIFWSAIAEDKLDIAKEYCSSQSQQLPSAKRTKLKNIGFDYGKIVIDETRASVETKIISSADKKIPFTTFLINENKSWKVDCQRSTIAFNGNQVFKNFFEELSNLGKNLNSQIEQQLPILEKEIESFGQELKQQLDNFEEELKKSFPEEKKAPSYKGSI